MKTFFVKMKAWQLVLLFALAYLLPILLNLGLWGVSLDSPATEFIEKSMLTFLRTLGMIIMLVALVVFLWRWSIGQFLYRLLPDKEEVNFRKYKLSLIINLALGIIWGVLFVTGYIFGLMLITGNTPYLLYLLIILFAVNALVFARINLFPYFAAKAILQELPFRAVTLSPTFFRFIRAIELQKEIHDIYAEFGISGKADQKTIL